MTIATFPQPSAKTGAKLRPARRACAYLLAVLIGSACGARSGLATWEGAGAPDASLDATGARCSWGFAPRVFYEAGAAPVAVTIADLDKDGHADVAANNYVGGPDVITLNTLHNTGDGTLVPWQSYPSTVSFSLARGAFLSGASSDLLVGCDLFPNQGSGVFGDPLAYSALGNCGAQDSYNNLALADFDSDGRVDFAWALLLSGLVVYLNRGGGAFDIAQTAPSPVTPYMDAITSADFDQDGRPDVAGVSWGYGYPNYLRIFHNDGGGTFAEIDIAQGSLTPKVIAAGDLNGDAWPDLAMVDAGEGLAILLNAGDGTFGPSTTYAFSEEVRSIVIGDLDADGASDVVLGGYSFSDLGVFYNHGDGTFAPAERWDVANSPWSLALGDLNGDGHLDVAVAETSVSNHNGVEVFLSRCE